MLFEPLAGRRHVEVTAHRTALDYARVVQEVIDVQYPQATTIVLVQDNLNTHVPASLYAAFPPTEARRLLGKLAIHYTPKHGSWLNTAETELSILSRQCLRRRIPEAATLGTEIAAWTTGRNAAKCKVRWQFTTADARIKLQRLYPVIEPVGPARRKH
jgi:hypothetical protein